MRIEEVINVVLKQGATRAKQISTKLIVVDERVRLKCFIPRCEDYGVCPVCPPSTLTSDEMRRLLKTYQIAIILQVDTNLNNDVNYFEGANSLHKIVLEGERSAFLAGARFATGLIGGSCHLCSACRKGEICPTPEKARPSMEAMSIDVFATCERVGYPIKFPVDDKVTWTGLILIN